MEEGEEYEGKGKISKGRNLTEEEEEDEEKEEMGKRKIGKGWRTGGGGEGWGG